MPRYHIHPLPLRDPIQVVIDRQMRSLAESWGQPPPQKHCHPQGLLEAQIADAVDEKASYGEYDGGCHADTFSLMR